MRRAAGVPLLLACLAAPGCLRLAYTARWQEAPLDRVALDGLAPGRDDLTSCLAALGAPHFAWEYRGDGMALGWVYGDTDDWTLSLSYTIDEGRSASFQYGEGDLDLPGAVLWFDADLRLLEWREGTMRSLVGERQRPAPVEDDGDGDGDGDR